MLLGFYDLTLKSNRIKFIGLRSSKNCYKWPRLITEKAKGWDTTGWSKFRRRHRRTVKRGTAIVLSVATSMSPRMKRSQFPLTICSSTGLLEH